MAQGAAQYIWRSFMVALIVSLAADVDHLYPDVNKEYITIIEM